MRRYGFNFQWMYVWSEQAEIQPADLKALDFLAEHGFDFVRVPTDYRFWVKDWNYLQPDESVWDHFEAYLSACKSRGIHMSLNIHRGPGYCINGNNLERDNLWLDQVAQDGFVYQWQRLAERFKGVSPQDLSFDLLNEPPDIDQYGMTRDIHEAIMRRAIAAIRSVDPDRPIVLDGLAGGNLAMPELADTGAVQSVRGYQPMAVSHFEASWWSGSVGMAKPMYPGTFWDGKFWDSETITEFYQPWRDLEATGVSVHVGEFGCHNRTPNDVALRWFADLLGVFRSFEWGFALWGFEGAFGIINHGRPNSVFEDYHGYSVDRKLLDLLMHARVGKR